MKNAAGFRKSARDSLRGKWMISVLTGFVASLFGAGIATSGETIEITNNSNSVRNFMLQLRNTEEWMGVRQIFLILTIMILIWCIAAIVTGGAVKMGYAVYNLKLTDRKDVSFSDLFSQLNRLGDGFCMIFLLALYTFLWSLLFVIPGIIKQYSYAMTPYILAENPGMTATEAITQSRHVMNGNKWRLFCLDFSFIGWGILCAAPIMAAFAFLPGNIINNGNITALVWFIPCIILTLAGSLFLTPYQEAAYAAFYREITVNAVGF